MRKFTKSLLMALISLLAVPLSSFADNDFTAIDWVAADQGYENAQDLDGVEIKLDDKTTVTFAKGTGSNGPKYYTSGNALRTYGGNVITFKGKGITKIIATGVSGKVTTLTPNVGEFALNDFTATWKGEADEVVLTNESKNQHHFVSIHLVYGGVEADAEPVHIANTAETAYTVAEAIALIDAGEALTETVFVKGIVSQVDKFDEKTKSITYWISADGTTEGAQFECYKGLGIDGAEFTSVDEVKVGAEVIVTGQLAKFKETYELAAGNKLVDYKEKAGATGRVWDFTKWSDATVANLKADAAASKTEGWSDVEKKADAEAGADPTEASKDNCFWYASTTNEDGSLSANGVVIDELKGLVFSNSYAPNRSLAIAVNYPSTSLGDYAGGAYLWLGGGKKKIPCFTIPAVAAGSTITMEVESHKPAEGRGVELYSGLDTDGLVDAATKIGDTFNPTVKESHTWTVETAGDVIVYNTNGCHIYNITVEEGTSAPEPILTLKGTVGEEVSIKPGVYGEFDIVSVDFGDGVLVTDSVGHQNKGVSVNDGSETWPQKEGTTHTGITEFKGTVAGDGIIKVYGNDNLWYLSVSGAVPTSFDQEKMKKLVQFTISKVAVDAIDLKGLDDLKIFGFSQGSLKNINVKDNAALTNLTINNNTASTFESVLESLDLSGNANLEQLNLMAASADKPGKLTVLDLSKNTKLANLYAQYNALTSVILPEGAALSFANLQNNQLESIDLSKVASLKDIYLNNNKLTTVDLSKLVAGANLYLDGNQLAEVEVPVSVKNLQLNNNNLTKVSIVGATASCKLEGNLLTLATIPAQPAGMNTASKTKKFTYAPQAELEAAVSNMELDLTSQLTVEKGELNPDDFASWLTGTTTFSFLTASGDTLVEGTDYVVVEPGKFKFLKEQAETVHAEMLNSALPKFTAAAPFKTTEFEVKEGAPLADFADGKYYLQNIGSGKTWGAGNSWGTQGSLVKHPEYVILHKQADGTYFMETQVSNGGESYYFGGEYMDGAPVALTIIQGDELGKDDNNNPVYAYYVTVDGTNFYGWDGTENTVLARNLAAGDEKAQWLVIPYEMGVAKLAEATEALPMDATYLLLDPNFGRNNRNKSAWTGDDFGVNGDNTNMNAEKWGGNSQTFDISQTVDAPNGKYVISWNGFYRYNNTEDNTNDVAIAAHADGTEVINSFVYINGQDYPLTSIADDAASAALEGKLPFSQADASAAFGKGLYAQSAEVLVTDGKLTVGIKKTNHPGVDWTVWDNFELLYYGAVVEEDPELEAPTGWISEIANGNLAGDDASNFIAKEYPSTTPVSALIVAGAGKNGTRGIVVKSQDKVDQAWDSQFWIYLNETLPVGTKLHVEFDYKADKAGSVGTQSHAAPGAYLHWAAIGNVNFTEEWQHFSADVDVPGEAADMQSIALNLNDIAEGNTYYFDNFGVWVQKPAPVDEWADLIVNGNMEGESMECFYVTEQGVGGPFVAVATNGIGKDGGKAVKVQSQDDPAQDWDTQFFIRLPYQLPAGTKFKVSFDYKADKAGDFDTQAHTEPGGYIHWACIGSGSFTTDWQTYEKEGSITADMSKEGQLMQTIAFNLAKNKVATEFIFDNVKFEVEASVAATLTKNPAENPTPYPVGIYTLSADQQNGTIFDLQGRRVVAPRKGLYIIDGKKAVVK